MKDVFYRACVLVTVVLLSSCTEDKTDNSYYDHFLPNISDNYDSYYTKSEGVARMVTYDVSYCTGKDKKTDCDRIAGILKRLDADVICLQETDNTSATSQPGYLGNAIGMQAYMSGGTQRNGVALLSKEDVMRIEEASFYGCEALVAEYQKYAIINALFPEDPGQKMEMLHVLTERAVSIGKKVYLAGNFRESNRYGNFFSELNKNWEQVSTVRDTYSDKSGSRCIDYIFTLTTGGYSYKIFGLGAVNALPDYDISKISLHYPVFVDFE